MYDPLTTTPTNVQCDTNLPDFGTLWFCGPGDEPRHGQSHVTCVDKVLRLHQQRQTMDVVQ